MIWGLVLLVLGIILFLLGIRVIANDIGQMLTVLPGVIFATTGIILFFALPAIYG